MQRTRKLRAPNFQRYRIYDQIIEALFQRGTTQGEYIDKMARLSIFLGARAVLLSLPKIEETKVIEIAPWDPTDTLLALLAAAFTIKKYTGIGLIMDPAAKGIVKKRVDQLWNRYRMDFDQKPELELLEGVDAFRYATKIKKQEFKKDEFMMSNAPVELAVIKDAASFITSTRRKNRSGIAKNEKYTGKDFTRLVKSYGSRAPLLIYEATFPVGCAGSSYKPDFKDRAEAIEKGIEGIAHKRVFAFARQVGVSNELRIYEHRRGSMREWLKWLENMFPKKYGTPQCYIEGLLAITSPFRWDFFMPHIFRDILPKKVVWNDKITNFA